MLQRKALNSLLTRDVLMSFVTQMLLTGAIAIFTYITNRQPQALVFCKNPPVNNMLTMSRHLSIILTGWLTPVARGNKLEILGKIKKFFFVLKNNLEPLLHETCCHFTILNSC